MTATEQDGWRSVESLLALIVDPKACEQQVAELKEEQDHLQELVVEHQTLLAEAEHERKRAEQTLAAAVQERESAQRLVDEAKWRNAQANERTIELEKRERKLRQFEGELKHRAGEIA
jgi:chromosome segregation ATPase